ncbi:DUF1326 domain-containing protein [Roseibium salinum]|uniref:DUF1326 domain-containing protein n=1 Tax=Roseibium salinum TaxID=1604349 RepID=UPI0035EB0A85
MKDWSIQARELANCNCNFGCPCQFGVLPTTGNCEAVVVYDIEKGHYGDTRLDGLRAAGIYKWPGAIHEGNGECQLIIDERADADQREALEAIMSGKDTEEMATMWFVYSAMAPNKHPTLTAPIELDWDQDERSGHAKVGNAFSVKVGPIPNIVTGAPHRVSIQLPHGFEFRHAEMASGSARTGDSAISLEFNSSHAHLANLHLTGQGVAAA